MALETNAANLVPLDVNARADIVLRSVPVVSATSVITNMLPIGATTSVIISGSNFLEGAFPWTDATITNVVIVDENTITADITVAGNRTPGAHPLFVNLLGTGPGALNGSAGICSDCVTFF